MSDHKNYTAEAHSLEKDEIAVRIGKRDGFKTRENN